MAELITDSQRRAMRPYSHELSDNEQIVTKQEDLQKHDIDSHIPKIFLLLQGRGKISIFKFLSPFSRLPRSLPKIIEKLRKLPAGGEDHASTDTVRVTMR